MNKTLSQHGKLDQPSPWVVRFAPLIPAGEVLDLACGSGRHARLLSGSGHAVLAVDRDSVVLESANGPRIVTHQIDLEAANAAWPFEADRFAGIVVTNYLHRPLFPHLIRSLAAGGVLVYETFTEGNEQFGKPSNPAFLLKQGELWVAVSGAFGQALRVVAFEDGYVERPKPAMVQRICAVKVKADTEAIQLRLS